jgi:hypothetical protein
MGLGSVYPGSDSDGATPSPGDGVTHLGLANIFHTGDEVANLADTEALGWASAPES